MDENIIGNLDYIDKRLITVPRKTLWDYLPDVLARALRRVFRVKPSKYELWVAQLYLFVVSVRKTAEEILQEEATLYDPDNWIN